MTDATRVIVTGGASGIGAATAASLVADGRAAAIIDRSTETEGIASELGAIGIVADVADSVAPDAAVSRAAEEMGGVDGLFANAGVGNLKALHTYTDAEFERIIAVNLSGTFFSLRSVVPLMLSGGGGAIVTMASVSGVRPTRGEGPYSAAKAAVIALTESAALEYGPTIRANCVSPGFVRTPLNEFVVDRDDLHRDIVDGTPLGAVGDPAQVADVVRFLLSDAAGYVTGQNLVIDGGSLLPSKQVDGVLSKLLNEFGTHE
jgi:NAD(P)-dependent dehydrogenase (short-subunit alcohol dehydrogenase family)